MKPIASNACTAALAALITGPLAAAPLRSAACSARSAAGVTPVFELYTSEGCSSCPPADRWLSRLKDDPGVVALAFHVDYWDRLGWKDRYASAAFTQRQAQQLRVDGARFSYTPQVVVDGIDRTDWSRLAPASPPRGAAAADVALTLARDADGVSATVVAGAGAPQRLAAYWTVTEQNFVSMVKAGENGGATLRHDFVVRDYRPVAPWSARADAPHTLRFDFATVADPAHPRAVNLVVIDAASGRPVQALKLAC